jgi:peptidase C13-like protein
MEQCYSGGMMDDILVATPAGASVCVMTAARFDEVSWSADTEGNYDEYVFHWTSAVHGKPPSGTPINADANSDGKIAMWEAHQYARTHDSAQEHPQIGESINGACDTTLIKAPDLCDINMDGKIDRSDLQLVLQGLGRAVSVDPRDIDGDGKITVVDARQCVLRCSHPNCTP